MTRKETIMALAKGMRGRAKNCFSIAIRRVEKGLQHAYRGRKIKKRVARKEWIGQVGAGCREHGLSYSRLIHGMNLSSIGVNRKMMALLAQQEPYSFRAIVEEAKLGLKKAVETDPRYAKTPRTKKYPKWLVELAKEKGDLAADQWKLWRPRQSTAPPLSKDAIFAAAQAARARERAEAEANGAAPHGGTNGGANGEAVLGGAVLFPGDLARAQKAKATGAGAGAAETRAAGEAGLAEALDKLDIGGNRGPAEDEGAGGAGGASGCEEPPSGGGGAKG